MHEDEFLAKIPKQRLIFLVKHLISKVDSSKPSFLEVQPHVLSETMKALIAVVGPLKETYGVFWEQLLGLVLQTWLHPDLTQDNHVSALFTSLQLYELLKKLSHEESNDDLCDAWAENEASLQSGLLQLLVNLSGMLPFYEASGAPSVAKSFSIDISDSSHEPRKILNELLARQLENFSGKFTLEDADFYPVLASESLSLQLSAYEILHLKIPGIQEQASLEKALSKDFVSKLPKELLSLILAAPRLESPAEAILGSDMNPVVQSYLLSWKLVYDHWTNSSSALKADYVASLKEGAYLEGLLDFAFDILINKRSKPLDASQFEVSYHIPRPTDTAENNTHWLIIHLYYLSLKHLPVLSKVWWRDSTSRQKVIAVEAWTEKYVCHLLSTPHYSKTRCPKPRAPPLTRLPDIPQDNCIRTQCRQQMGPLPSHIGTTPRHQSFPLHSRDHCQHPHRRPIYANRRPPSSILPPLPRHRRLHLPGRRRRKEMALVDNDDAGSNQFFFGGRRMRPD